jgi:threonyl-tRNA synthetase
VTGYDPHGSPSEAAWLRRIIFLETVAGVPGMVGGAIRHLQSLRLMRYDGGWIADLLAESENERMHLCTFMELRKPGPLFRAAVLVAQGVFWNMYFCTYLASPKTAHSMVGYLEEEAVKTYTHALAEIDAGRLWADGTVKVPKIAKHYWSLPHGCTMRDLVLAVRADEWDHARVNHTFSLIPDAAPNPFAAAKNSSTAVKGSVGGKQEL